MKYSIVVVLLAWSIAAMADDSKFSTHLYAKFQAKSCTNCHDFFDEKRGGLAFKSHKGRTPDNCVYCHSQAVTGFKHADEWFARSGLYTSGMDAKQTCESIKTALFAEFKNEKLLIRQMEIHLFEDPRVQWGIEKATPNSGNLPGDAKAKGLVTGGLEQWKTQVRAWMDGGMKCE